MDYAADIVQHCIEAIWEAGDRYGLARMRVDRQGDVFYGPGTRSITVKVRMVYKSGEVRQAVVHCLVMDDGQVQVLP